MIQVLYIMLAFVSLFSEKPNAKKLFVILRTEYAESGVSGYAVLLDADGQRLFDCYTLEKRWNDNEPFTSCIPVMKTTAVYRSPSESQKITYPHLLVEDVPERQFILIHKANTATQLEGCIAVGKERRKIVGIPTLLQSDEAMSELMSCIEEGERIDFLIRDVASPTRFQR